MAVAAISYWLVVVGWWNGSLEFGVGYHPYRFFRTAMFGPKGETCNRALCVLGPAYMLPDFRRTEGAYSGHEASPKKHAAPTSRKREVRGLGPCVR